MKKNRKVAPPRWAQSFLRWYCKPGLAEDLEGDLNEYFFRNIKASGTLKARIVYIIDVFKFLRLYTIRTPELITIIIHWIMLGSYIKTSSRNILRHKLFSSINIVGLAVSMSVGLLMIVFVSDLRSYDNFHLKKDRIYRIISQDHNQVDLASTSVVAGKIIKEDGRDIEDITILRRGFGGDASTGDRILPVGGLWADDSFLNVFTFPMLHGDPVTALREPYSIVLTEETAKKLFGTSQVLGKSLKFDTTHYFVTGVLKDIPKLSHLRFGTLVSFSTLELAHPDTDDDFMDWGNVYQNYVYVVLPENSVSASLQSRLDKISAQQNAIGNNNSVTLGLQRLTEISIGRKLDNQLGPKLPDLAIWILLGLTFIVVISACFNYTNLSIARSLRRSREVGIRKVIGATKSNVMNQFVVESILISLMALAFSFLIFLFLREQFLSLHPFVESLVTLELSSLRIYYFITFAIIVGIIAGILPALFYTKVNAIQVLKNVSSLQLFRHINVRKTLIVAQYVFSLIFITITIMGYKQYRSFVTFDLGFTTENVVNIFLQGNKADLVTKKLSELPEVAGISKSLLVMSLGRNYNVQAKHMNSNDSANVLMNIVDEHYLELHDHEFLAGHDFTPRSDQSDESELIVTEQFLKMFNLPVDQPSKTLGDVIIIEGKKLRVVGVLKDFHYKTVEDEIQPVVFRHFNNPAHGYVNVKLTTTNWLAAMSKIEDVWKGIDSVHPLDAAFYDDQIEHAYSQFSMMIKVIGFLAFLAICIASMGLFGMVVFTTETRMREVSIRKVFGANELKMVLLLSRGFMFLLFLAATIALPATYLFFDNVVLVNFAYHEPIQVTDILAGLAVVIAVAGLMVGAQTFNVARSNPAEVLKNE